MLGRGVAETRGDAAGLGVKWQVKGAIGFLDFAMSPNLRAEERAWSQARDARHIDDPWAVCGRSRASRLLEERQESLARADQAKVVHFL